MQEFSTTAVGNLVADPQFRVVASGAPVCSFRIGITPRYRNRDTGVWSDGTSMFLSVSCWRSLAENVAESLHRGDRVVVIGRMRQRAYVTGTGEERLVWEVDADCVAPDLSRHTAMLRRPTRSTVTMDGDELLDPGVHSGPVAVQPTVGQLAAGGAKDTAAQGGAKDTAA